MAARTREELERALRKHLNFIQRSSQWYDEGWLEEAERIAVSLRVLFHTTEASTALVEQLGMNRIRLHSTRKNGEDFTGRVYLIELGFDQTYSGMSVPVRSGCTFKRVSVSRWWNLELIGIPTLQRPRRDLVLSLANKDGAHIDPRLGQDDRALRAFGNIVYSTESQIGDGWTETNYHYPRFPLHACIRQMAHEVLATPALKPWIGTAL